MLPQPCLGSVHSSVLAEIKAVTTDSGDEPMKREFIIVYAAAAAKIGPRDKVEVFEISDET